MTRAPLVLPALAFIAALIAEARGYAPLACGAALVSLAVGRARRCGAFAIGGLLVAGWLGHPPIVTAESHAGRFAGTVVGDVRAGPISHPEVMLARVIGRHFELGTNVQFAGVSMHLQSWLQCRDGAQMPLLLIPGSPLIASRSAA